MSEILLSALSSSIFLVRIMKGPWMRNPQYLAAAIIGAVAVSLLLNSAAPDLESGFLTGGLAGLGGGWAGIFAFDLIAA